MSIPDNDRIWASVALSYNVTEKLSFDAGYSHIFVKNATVRLVAANPQFVNPLVFTGGTKPWVDLLSLAIRYRWDDPQIAIPAGHILR